MSQKFYCQKKGGINRGDFGPKSLSKNENEELIILEGTGEKGPWYNALEFSDEQIEFYVAKGWLVWEVE
jgi:hypothetical protein